MLSEASQPNCKTFGCAGTPALGSEYCRKCRNSQNKEKEDLDFL